ncbi:hypothetical protein M514_14744 [Trichuris suis]|uniref:Uncharacterized protein n=1 Tax=Trichuris suis TaxID=68888 RepID=A0A085NTP4_9BILA|nr:hypothetical protein M514_14744 [Trichuris suis]
MATLIRKESAGITSVTAQMQRNVKHHAPMRETAWPHTDGDWYPGHYHSRLLFVREFRTKQCFLVDAGAAINIVPASYCRDATRSRQSHLLAVNNTLQMLEAIVKTFQEPFSFPQEYGKDSSCGVLQTKTFSQQPNGFFPNTQ